jgi:predicted double-glycine peptidase
MKNKLIKYFNTIIVIIFVLIALILVLHQNVIKKTDPLCGPKSLFEICKLMNIDTDLKEICQLTGYDKKRGTSMLSLYQAAIKIGLPAVPARISIEQLFGLGSPAIAFVNNNHFVVILGNKKDKLIIQNPPSAPLLQSKEEFKSNWNGETLIFSKKLKDENDKQLTKNETDIKGPRIKVDGMYYDFGIINEGDKIKHTFYFKNIGTSDLKVYSRSSCSCTISSISSRIIPPGKTGDVTIELDTNGRKGLTNQTVYLKTNDPVNKETILTISGTVEPSIKVVPEKIWFDEVVVNSAISREILIVGSKKRGLSIENIDAPKGIKTKLLRSKSNDDNITIPVELTINTGEIPGNFDEKIKIFTNDKKRPVIIVPVTGVFIQNVKAYPPVFFFGDVSADEYPEREVLIVSSDKNDIRSIKAKSGSESINIEVNTIEQGKKYSIKAKLNSNKNDLLIKDNILVYLNNEVSPVLRIPLYLKINNL